MYVSRFWCEWEPVSLVLVMLIHDAYSRCYASFCSSNKTIIQSYGVGGGRWVLVCLSSKFLLFMTQYVRYLMAFQCMFFMRILISDFGTLILASFLMKCLCMAPLTPTMMVMRGFTFHPLFCMVLFNGSYLVCFCSRLWLKNLDEFLPSMITRAPCGYLYKNLHDVHHYYYYSKITCSIYHLEGT